VVVGFRTKTAQASGAILGEREDARLKHIDSDIKGRCYLQVAKEVKVQVPYLTSEQAKALVEPYQRKVRLMTAK